MLDILLFAAIIIKVAFRATKIERQSLASSSGVSPSGALYSLKSLFINFAIQTGEVVAVNGTIVHAQVQKFMGKSVQR